MAIYSNLSGTMQKQFQLGKSGAQIQFENGKVSVLDNTGKILLPVQIGTPVSGNDAVTLDYMNSNPYVLYGDTVPDNSIGENKNIYFLISNQNTIADIYVKKNGTWLSSDFINKDLLSSTNGADYIGLLSGGTLQQSQFYVTPEEFGAVGDGSTDDTNAIKACIAYAQTSKTQIQANNNYRIKSLITFENVNWFGGTITGNGGTQLSVINSQIQQCEFIGCYLKFLGGDGKFYFNKFHNTTATAAFLMQSMTSTGRVDFCFNELYNCNYGILQQGTGEIMQSGRFSYNHFHDIGGDAVELNVINSHYPEGFSIDGNLIENVDGTNAPIANSNWGIGIGVAGKGPYGIDIPDSQYVQNFSICRNRIYNVRQCIHVELGKNFTIKDNEVYPSTLVSSGTGLTTAGVITYGCQNFEITGLTGRLLNDPSVTTRMIYLGWGVVNGQYAGPPINFKLSDIYTPESSIEVYTTCSDTWTNDTDMNNVTCNELTWRGLPSSSTFSSVKANKIDFIGRHLSTEGPGGGLYARSSYTYTNWVNCTVPQPTNINANISKFYVDRIDQAANNFKVQTDIDGTGHRGPVLIPIAEQYYLPYDEFPGGRYFPAGTVFHRNSGGKYIVTVGGCFMSANERLRPTVVGQTYIQSAGVSWGTNQYAKAAGTQIIIPGAGENGTDLLTTITRATYVVNSLFTVDIADPIITPTPTGTILRAAQAITYITIP